MKDSNFNTKKTYTLRPGKYGFDIINYGVTEVALQQVTANVDYLFVVVVVCIELREQHSHIPQLTSVSCHIAVNF